MKQKNLTLLTLTALFCAIIIALTFIPQTGYIVYGGLSITTLHVVVILGAITLGPVRGTLLGAVWGLTCLAYAFFNGTADALIFLNPLISVVPRILVGLAAAWYFRAFDRLLRRRFGEKGSFAAAAITAVLATLTNTVLVLSAIQLFGLNTLPSLGSAVQTIIQAALAFNCVFELILAMVVVPVVSGALRKVMKRWGQA